MAEQESLKLCVVGSSPTGDALRDDMQDDEKERDEESVADERAGKRPSDLVEEKLRELLTGRPLPVSSLRNCKNVRPPYNPTRRSRS